MTFQVYRCERLSASISERQCGINRSQHISCQGCPGLGAQVVMEVDGMGKIGTCATCGREVTIHKGGDCKRCWDRRDAGKDPITGNLLVHQADERSVAAVCPGCGELAAAGMVTCLDCADPVVQPTVADSQPLRGGITRLLEPDGWLIEIPRSMAIELQEQAVTADEIVEMVGWLLKGELRRVA